MARDKPARPEHHGTDETGKPRDGKRGGPDQGIVRDERGQEQPADKERAQRTSKTKQT
jgi:hypothetical protein